MRGNHRRPFRLDSLIVASALPSIRENLGGGFPLR
ncbi:hypothetical protein QF032_008048 [Streptomyces achromogenes]|uniref:Uncharacterized protein n=1 Tax=Streptomyces achromogenes TaxID=67255 RepID=A0ABU0QEA0_STRAH|nr:hypothetical protein [Streptomyces achromogenes]MDQ0688988.1 hypothetical protein [Streptomyces achromogenes]MDQ0836204.1 hypothetical protein [Streptomyces achromogenes]